MSTPSVSIILPVYNMQAYLRRCLHSILAQTYTDFELIIVDDGSTDGSAAIAEEFRTQDRRITILRKTNGGLSSARNVGLDAAVGAYIYFADSDDYLEPTLLQECVAQLEEQHCDCCSFGMRKELEDGALLEEIHFKPRSIAIHSEEERMHFLLHELLNYRMGWEAWNRLFRADIIRAHHLRFVSEREIFAEDLLFSFTFWLYATSCVVMDRCLYHYVQREASLMGESRRRNVLPQIHQLAKAACRAVEQAQLPTVRRDFAAIYLHLLEWQARPYMLAHGIDWVQQELSALGRDLFHREIAFPGGYVRMLRAYGAADGFVTVCLTVAHPAELPAAQTYLNALQGQSLQKLDILLLHHPDVQPPCDDFRVRCLPQEDATADALVRTAFRESRGEYLYFADLHHPIPTDFLERCSDALKYNACGTLVLQDGASHFFDIYSPEQRSLLRQALRENRFAPYQAMVCSDLLPHSMYETTAPLSVHMDTILLSDHVLFLEGGAPA